VCECVGCVRVCGDMCGSGVCFRRGGIWLSSDPACAHLPAHHDGAVLVVVGVAASTKRRGLGGCGGIAVEIVMGGRWGSVCASVRVLGGGGVLT
jgi:hypothetical protein